LIENKSTTIVEHMVDKPDMNPKHPSTGASTGAHKPQPKSEFKTPEGEHKGWAQPMKWLGMEFTAEQTKQLWNIISQSISTQIKKEQDRAVKAIRKLRSDDPSSQDDDS